MLDHYDVILLAVGFLGGIAFVAVLAPFVVLQ